MGKLADLQGAITNIFQLGIGAGSKTLRFFNGFSGDLQWNPTANRTIALPDASGTLALTSQLGGGTDAVRRLFSLHTQQTITGTTTQTQFAGASYTMPANTMGVNSAIEIRVGTSFNNNANTKTLTVRFGGQSVIATGFSTSQTGYVFRLVANRNASNAQILNLPAGSPNYTATGAANIAPTILTIDTTQDVVIDVFGTLTNSADNIRLELFEILLIP